MNITTLKKIGILFIPIIAISVLLVLVLSLISPKTSAEQIKKEIIKIDNLITNKATIDPGFKSSYPTIEDYEVEFKEIFQLGIGAIPQLMESIENKTVKNQAFNISAIWYLISAEDALGRYNGGEYSKDPDSGRPIYFVKIIREKIAELPTEIEKIATSDMTTEEKIKAVNKYGMLAMPIIADRIDAGEKYWEEYVALQVFDSSIEKRFEIIKSFKTLEDLSVKSKKNKVSKDFDAKEWLKKNNEDIMLLKKIY